MNRNPDISKVVTGDMPGDKVQIGESHILRANKVYPILKSRVDNSGKKKIVISIFGGSGVGKSEIGSLIAHFFKEDGLNSYVLSGDNYPRRIPQENDALRLKTYEEGGKKALEKYLGTDQEIDFNQLNSIISDFKSGKDKISLKRMGRTPDSIFFEDVDFSGTDILVIEWTHGNNKNLKGVDFPVFLYSTPEETLEHRKARARDKGVDSPFTNVVLGIEQELLNTQALSAAIIIRKNGDILSDRMPAGVMLNAYPDSCNRNLAGIVELLKTPDFKDTFSSFYILPSMFQADLDRGFSVISYDLEGELATEQDLEALQDMGISLKLDFVLNHLSVQSPQFRDLLKNGDKSEHIDTFIDWNKFWEGKGELSEEGYIVPDEEYLSKLFMRKPGLPILKVPFPDGTYRFYWNTFYQKVTLASPSTEALLSVQGVTNENVIEIKKIIDNAVENELTADNIDYGKFQKLRAELTKILQLEYTSYLGQMDLNGESEKVWEFYEETFSKLSRYGAKIVRLDAFAYMHKEIGESNFFNEPGTWDYLARIKTIADKYELILLPEIHGKYEERLHEKLAQKGYPIYDFFFPGLVIHAIEKGDNTLLLKWIDEIIQNRYRTVNMLGCHDGIPLIDVKGLMSNETIDEMIEIVKSRGGRVKDLFGADGKKISYYQINATFFSAFNESEEKLLLARAIQMFMPGTPDIWYLDIFAGTNDYEAADKLGHKDINRTNLSKEDIEEKIGSSIVKRQLDLIRLRNTHPAFGAGADLLIDRTDDSKLVLIWKKDKDSVKLTADLKNYTYKIEP